MVAEDHDPIAEFRSAAESYVAVVETAEGRSSGELFVDVLQVLPPLYGAALRLPRLVAETDELPETRLTHEQWGEVFGRLVGVFGADDLYWMVEPFEEGKREELAGSLADDLADVYRDVKEGLELIAAGASEREVVWQWRFNFWAHWGAHAVDALRIIHTHVAADGGPAWGESGSGSKQIEN